MRDKFELYQENGVLEYWIVQPEHNNILAFSLENENFQLKKIFVDDDKISPALFPELVIDLADVF